MSCIRRNRKRERDLKYRYRQKKKAANFHGYFYHDEIYENGEAIKILKPFAPSPFKMFLCHIERQWHKIEKWQKSSYHYTNTYQYILDNGFIPYFRCMKDGFEVYPNPQLNLPVPFKSGDIITVCDRPFADEKQVLILDVGNNIDCACVQVLYVTNNGIVKVNSLKHGYIFEDDNALMYTSPLYKAQKFKGNTEDIHKTLLMVQRYMADKPCVSAVLINVLKDKDLLSDDITVEKLNSLLFDKTD